MDDLYKEASEWGLKKAREDEGTPGGPESDYLLMKQALYWTAWFAGRRASEAVLIKAREVGVTPEQWEALRATAAEVAYD